LMFDTSEKYVLNIRVHMFHSGATAVYTYLQVD